MSLILYTRRGCHLCEDFEQELRRVQQERPFDCEVRDVDAQPVWRAAYHAQVPLLLADEREISRYFLDVQALRAWLGKRARG